MNRIQIGALISAATFVAGVTLARQSDTPTTSSESTSTTKTKSSAGTMKSKTHTATGTVKDFESGKKITVTTANKKNRSWDLDDKDTTYDVDSSVAVGQKVKVSEMTDDSGHKTVTVKPYMAAHHHTMKKKSTSTSSASPSTS